MPTIKPTIPDVQGLQDPKATAILKSVKLLVDGVTGRSPTLPKIKTLGTTPNLYGVIAKINEIINRLQSDDGVPTSTPQTSAAASFATSIGAANGDVVGPSAAVAGHLAVFGDITGKLIADGGAPATGDVVGPAIATANGVVLYNSTTGKLVKDAVSTDGLIHGLTLGRGASSITTNTVLGKTALAANTTGARDVAVGNVAMTASTTADDCTAVGNSTLGSATTGDNNTAVGSTALAFSTADSNNTAVGMESLLSLDGGSSNTAVGKGAGSTITTGAKNTILGRYNGNQGGLDIRGSTGYIVISDGDGNPRSYCDAFGNWIFGGSAPTGAATTDKLQVNGNANIGGVKISPFGIANLTTNSMAFSSSNVTSGTSGSFTLVSGDGSSTASSGSIVITSGTIISGPGSSGDVNIFSGSAINGNTGNVGVFSNATSGSGNVGYAFIAGGAAGGAGAGGWVYINAGGSVSGTKGEVQITKTDEVTPLMTLNDTGIGFFAGTPAAQQTLPAALGGGATLAQTITQVNAIRSALLGSTLMV